MMNRTLPLLAWILLMGFGFQQLQAQCTPDPNATGLVSPDTLPTACPNQFYDVTLTLNIPPDTTVSGFTVTIDSLRIDGIAGLPAGLTTDCNPVSCAFPGNSSGCVRIFGTPTDTGEFAIELAGTVFVDLFGSPQSFSDTLPGAITITVGLTADPISTTATCNGSDGSATVAMNTGTGPYTFLWDDPNTQTDSIATGLSAGTYEVTVTDATGCVGVFEVNVSNSGGAVIDPAQSAQGWLGCHNVNGGFIDATVVGGQAPYTYSWNTGDTTPNLDSLSAGTYTLTVTDDLGCITSQSFQIDAPNPLVVSTTSVEDVLCYGGNDGSITALAGGGQGNFLYRWDTDPVVNSPALSALEAGTYTLTVEDELGCVRTLEVEITEPDSLAVTFEVRTEDPVGASDGRAEATVTGGTPPYTYTWEGNISDSAAIDSVAGGTYTLTVTDDNGCTLVDSVTIDVTSSIEAMAGLNRYQVFPNPAQDRLTVALGLDAPQAVLIELYDLQGRRLQSRSYEQTSDLQAQLDLSKVPAGLYLLSVEVNGYRLQEKLRVE